MTQEGTIEFHFYQHAHLRLPDYYFNHAICELASKSWNIELVTSTGFVLLSLFIGQDPWTKQKCVEITFGRPKHGLQWIFNVGKRPIQKREWIISKYLGILNIHNQ